MRYITLLVCILCVFSLTFKTSNAETDNQLDEIDVFTLFVLPEISKPFYQRFRLEKGPTQKCEQGYEIVVLPPEYKYCWWQYSEISRGGASWLSIQEPGVNVRRQGIVVNWKIQTNGHIGFIPAGERGSIVAEFIVAGVKEGAICPNRPLPFNNGADEVITQDSQPDSEPLKCTKPP